MLLSYACSSNRLLLLGNPLSKLRLPLSLGSSSASFFVGRGSACESNANVVIYVLSLSSSWFAPNPARRIIHSALISAERCRPSRQLISLLIMSESVSNLLHLGAYNCRQELDSTKENKK